MESWCLALEMAMAVTQFCGISRGEASICLEFTRVKWQNLKIPGVFLKIKWSQPLAWIFLLAECNMKVALSSLSQLIQVIIVI